MTTHGPIALLGGGEHLPPCEAGDRRLLESTGAPAPTVAVIPAASARGAVVTSHDESIEFPHGADLPSWLLVDRSDSETSIRIALLHSLRCQRPGQALSRR